MVDANFSTLWPDTAAPTALATAGIIALLSSTWAQALLEATATVMGGGALKVEATHIRRLALPTPDPAQATELEGLGQQLVSTGGSDKVVDAIDRTMTQMLFPAFPAANSAL